MALNKGYLTAENTRESDETFTPDVAIQPLIPFLDEYYHMVFGGNHIERNKLDIWCPFDTAASRYVKVLGQAGYNVIHSHIADGQDFFEYEPEEHYHIIVSNPPFSIKDKILKRCYELEKPYMLLLPVPVIQGQKRFEYLIDSQLIVFDKRINYYRDPSLETVQKGVSFGSLYVCRDCLEKDINWVRLPK